MMMRRPVLYPMVTEIGKFIFLLTRQFKAHAFLSLLSVAYFTGLATGMDPVQVNQIVAKGFGGTVERIGIMIVAGAIIGVALARSGAVYVIAETILKVSGEKRPALAMSVMGYFVSIPIFCDAAFILLSSLIKSLAKRTGVSATTIAVAFSTGLYATYTLVPPTPGPVAALNVLGADIGVVLTIGLLAAIPAAAVGYFWAIRYTGRFDHTEADAAVSHEELIALYPKLPGVLTSFMPIFVPMLLIALKSIANLPGTPFGKGCFKLLLDFAGEPMVALLLGMGSCLFLVKEISEEDFSDWINQGIKDAAPIVLIIAASGALANILTAVGIGDYLGRNLLQYNLGIFLPFIIAAALKTLQGSSLVALITTSTVMFPLLNTLGLGGPVGAALTTIAIGAGSMMVSHVNDPYFWIVTQFSGLKADVTCKTLTIATFLMGMTSMATVWLLALLLL